MTEEEKEELAKLTKEITTGLLKSILEDIQKGRQRKK